MHIDIQARDFPLTDALQRHAERRLHYALSRNDERIRRVEMRLSDVNGPRGGRDKRCRLRLVLNGMPDVHAEDTQADLYTAIDRAADRVGRSLTRKLKRQLPGGGRPRITDRLDADDAMSAIYCR